MSKKMLIDATHPEETRVVVVDGSKVEEFDFESLNKRQLTGNIYLAKVTRVEPSLQAAFVEYGGNRHGFLAFSEIHPDYYQIPVADREALLAAEEREEQSDAEEAPKAEAKPRRSRRSSSRSRASSASTDDAMTVVDLAADESDSDGSAAAEPVAEAAETTEPEVKTAAQTEAEAMPSGDAAPDDAATAPEADDQADPDSDGSTPRSIAESTGADDGESVSEEAPAPAASDAAEAPDAEKPKRRPRRSRKKTTEAAESAGDTEGAAPAETAVAEAATAEPAAAEAVSGDAAVETAEETETQAATEEGEEEAKPKARRRRSSRTRRSRKDDEAGAAPAAEAATEASGEAAAEDKVENLGAEAVEDEVRPRRAKMRSYKIQEVIKVRQIMLVQVVKEERGNKGAALTTYLSLAGRYCVLMPNTARGGGISRKITNADDRKKLKEIAGEFEVPKGMGLIIRTAGAQRTRSEIKRDYEFLLRQWDQIRELTLKSVAPTLIYEEGSLIKRSIRDLYTKDIGEILVAGDEGYREAKDYMRMLMPSHAKHVQPYREATPLFTRYQVESYLAAMFNPVVQLKSGGYIVIGVTEALVAIDVNSGRSTREGSIEDTALKTNLEAADEVARQLRLRDLAGLIVIDFIDMDERKNNAAVEKRMKERLKNDRARIQMGRISAFGLMEMSRQRLRPGMLEASTAPCPHCHGTGLIRSLDSLALSILREIEEEGVRRRSAEVRVMAPVQVANFLINSKREHIAAIELRYGLSVLIEGDPALISPEYRLEKLKSATRPTPVPEQPAITASGTLAELDDPRDAEEAEETESPAESRRAEDDRNRDGENGKSRRRRGRRGGRKRRREDEGAATSENGDTAAMAEDGAAGAMTEQPEPERAEAETAAGEVEAAPPAAAPGAEAEPVPVASEAEPAPPAPETVAEAAEPAPAPKEQEPAPSEPEAATEEAREPEPAVASAETPEPAPEAPRRPRRTGWWSLGSR